MGLTVLSYALVQAISDSVDEIRREVFAGPTPRFLYHYTRADKVESIVQSRSIWAKSIKEQTDKGEISHAVELLTQAAGRIAHSEPSTFAKDVLGRLPFFMEERKEWIFIACFCEDSESEVHWERYGDYCLAFPFPRAGVKALSILDVRAECWYQRVIYDEARQRNAIESAIQSVALALARNATGINDGFWAQANIDFHARNVAQLLLRLAVGFKRESFADEGEWRIVCSPRLGTNSSAPKYEDECFNVNIRQSPFPHVSFRIQPDRNITQPVPFVDWRHNPSHCDVQDLDRINKTLRMYGREDLIRSNSTLHSDQATSTSTP